MSPRTLVKAILAAGLATGVIYASLSLLWSEESWLHQFFFERSFVQWMTTFTFSLAMVLVFGGVISYLRLRGEVSTALKGEAVQLPETTQIGSRIARVRRSLVEHGRKAAAHYAHTLEQKEVENLRGFHGFVGSLGQLMLVLGLFGTILGLTRSLNSGYSGGVVDRETVSNFARALSTALDTTVLAMVCAGVAGIFNQGLRSAGEAQCKQINGFVTASLGLNDVEWGDDLGEETASGRGDRGQKDNLSLFALELRSVTGAILTETKVALEKVTEKASEAVLVCIREFVRDFLASLQNSQEGIADRLGGHIAESLAGPIRDAATAIEKQNGKTAKILSKRFDQIMKKRFPRTPQEIVVRWEPPDGSDRGPHEDATDES